MTLTLTHYNYENVLVPLGTSDPPAQPLFKEIIRLGPSQMVGIYYDEDDPVNFVPSVETLSIDGTTVTEHDSDAIGGLTSYGVAALTRLTDTEFACVFNDGDGSQYFQIKVYEVDGSLNLSDVDTVGPYATALPTSVAIQWLTDEWFVAACNTDNSGASRGVFRLCQLSGGSITSSAEFQTHPAPEAISELCINRLDDDDFVIFWTNDSSGELEGVRVLMTTPFVATVGTVATVVSGTAENISCAAVDTDWSLLTFTLPSQADNLFGIMANITLTSITLGPPSQLKVDTIESSSVLKKSAGNYLLAYANSAHEGFIQEVTTSGATISPGTETDINNGDVFSLAIAWLEEGIICAQYRRTENAGGTDDIESWISFTAQSQGVKVLGQAVSVGGSTLYVTGWSAGELILNVYDIPALTLSASNSLGDATEAEVDNKTYWAFPAAGTLFDDEVVIFGRLNDPAGLGLCHIIYSVDAGVNFSVLENSWGDDHCGSFLVGSLVGYAIRNVVASLGGATTQARLYKDYISGTPGLVSTLPFSSGVEPGAMWYDRFANILVGADTGQSEMVIYAPPPYTVWEDITGNHQTADPVKSLETIS